jgi:hypothetical protein
MRYHKAVEIRKEEADFIADASLSSLNENVVICCAEKWYDVRRMTEKELEAFLADLLRALFDDVQPLADPMIIGARSSPDHERRPFAHAILETLSTIVLGDAAYRPLPGWAETRQRLGRAAARCAIGRDAGLWPAEAPKYDRVFRSDYMAAAHPYRDSPRSRFLPRAIDNVMARS